MANELITEQSLQEQADKTDCFSPTFYDIEKVDFEKIFDFAGAELIHSVLERTKQAVYKGANIKSANRDFYDNIVYLQKTAIAGLIAAIEIQEATEQLRPLINSIIPPQLRIGTTTNFGAKELEEQGFEDKNGPFRVIQANPKLQLSVLASIVEMNNLLSKTLTERSGSLNGSAVKALEALNAKIVIDLDQCLGILLESLKEIDGELSEKGIDNQIQKTKS